MSLQRRIEHFLGVNSPGAEEFSKKKSVTEDKNQISRRKFLQHLIIGLAGTAALPLFLKYEQEAHREYQGLLPQLAQNLTENTSTDPDVYFEQVLLAVADVVAASENPANFLKYRKKFHESHTELLTVRLNWKDASRLVLHPIELTFTQDPKIVINSLTQPRSNDEVIQELMRHYHSGDRLFEIEITRHFPVPKFSFALSDFPPEVKAQLEEAGLTEESLQLFTKAGSSQLSISFNEQVSAELPFTKPAVFIDAKVFKRSNESMVWRDELGVTQVSLTGKNFYTYVPEKGPQDWTKVSGDEGLGYAFTPGMSSSFNQMSLSGQKTYPAESSPFAVWFRE